MNIALKKSYDKYTMTECHKLIKLVMNSSNGISYITPM